MLLELAKHGYLNLTGLDYCDGKHCFLLQLQLLRISHVVFNLENFALNFLFFLNFIMHFCQWLFFALFFPKAETAIFKLLIEHFIRPVL